LLYWPDVDCSQLQAVIVAGGRGERMRPWTDKVPKPMIPIEGKPLLEHQLEWLKRAGVREAIMCLGYKAEVVQAHFGDGARLGMRLDYHIETSPRGTAGCVKDVWPRLHGGALVLYGDLFIDISLPDLCACHERGRGAATLVLIETDHPHDSDLVRTEGERITSFYRAQPGKPCGNLAAAAAWVVGGGLMDLVPADRPSDFGRDIFPQALALGRKLVGFQTQGVVADLGTPQRLEAFLQGRGAGRA